MCAVGVCTCLQIQLSSRMWLVFSGSEFDIRSELLAHKIELVGVGVYIMEFQLQKGRVTKKLVVE